MRASSNLIDENGKFCIKNIGLNDDEYKYLMSTRKGRELQRLENRMNTQYKDCLHYVVYKREHPDFKINRYI